MFPNPAFTLADQLFWIVDCFRKAMWADPRTRGLGPLSVAIWERVRGFERRFSRLYAMWRAGTLPPPRPSAARSLDRGECRKAQRERKEDPYAALNAVHKRPASLLPRAFRWLQGMLPNSAATLAAGTESLLWNYPEMKAFVADCPRVGRILRPMCRMAGLKAPEWLALPKRVRSSDPSPLPTGSSPVGNASLSHRGRGGRQAPTAADAAGGGGRRNTQVGEDGEADRSTEDRGGRVWIRAAVAARRELPAAGDRIRRTMAKAAEGLQAT